MINKKSVSWLISAPNERSAATVAIVQIFLLMLNFQYVFYLDIVLG